MSTRLIVETLLPTLTPILCLLHFTKNSVKCWFTILFERILTLRQTTSEAQHFMQNIKMDQNCCPIVKKNRIKICVKLPKFQIKSTHISVHVIKFCHQFPLSTDSNWTYGNTQEISQLNFRKQ